MSQQIQIRRGTAANWTSTNPVLADGEIGFETNTGKAKVGDGVTTWNALSYRFSSTGASAWGDITGTLANQADLVATLALKADLISPSFTTPSLGAAVATTINGKVIDSTLATTATRLDNFAAPTSSVSMNSQALTGLPTPSAGTDAANKNYVDSVAQGTKWKASVRVATTGNATLSTAFANGQTIDGVVLATNDRILIKDQTDATVNGIYTVNASGPPTRAVDADTGTEIVAAACTITEGSVNANRQFVNSNPSITLGVTSITFVSMGSSAGALIAANNLSDIPTPATARNNLGLGTLATQSGTFSGTSSGTNTGDQTDVTGNAGTVTVATESSDATCFLLFAISASGSLAPKTNSNLTFDSTTGELAATILTAATSVKVGSTGTIIFGSSNVVMTHSTGILTMGAGEMRITTPGTNSASVVTVGATQTLSGKALTAATFNTSFMPTADDGAAIGDATHGVSDLFAATGFVLNYGNGDFTITHATGKLTFSGPIYARVPGFAANTQTGTTYTLVLTDDGKLVTLSNGSAITLTIPTNASVAFPVGAQIDVVQLGAGQVTVSPTGGVTMNSYTSLTKLAGQYAGATLRKTATDTWLLIGNLSS